MATYYLDTSALAKRYITEPGQEWMRRLTMPRTRNGVYFSQLGLVELEVAIARKVSEGVLSARGRDRALALFQRHLRDRYDTVPVHDELIKRARQLVRQRGLPHPLRTYDAIHLASALELRDRLQRLGLAAPIFVTADRKLLTIAEHLGLPTENPRIIRDTSFLLSVCSVISAVYSGVCMATGTSTQSTPSRQSGVAASNSPPGPKR